MKQSTITLKLDVTQKEKAYDLLIGRNWKETPDPSEYVEWRLGSNEGVAIMYTSGKLVVQGTGEISFIDNVLEGLDFSIKDFVPHIGVDEVGKGDYFGPLVVTAAYVSAQNLAKINELGVGDSKKISDKRILEIFESLEGEVMHKTIVVSPEKYNETYPKYGNIAPMLADLHAEAVSGLLELGVESDYVVIDQFSKNKGRIDNAFKGIDIDVKQFHKGESDIAVALASVFARARFLIEWDKMGENYSTIFPKGASDVISFGKDFIRENGIEELKNVAKISFKTTQKISSFA